MMNFWTKTSIFVQIIFMISNKMSFLAHNETSEYYIMIGNGFNSLDLKHLFDHSKNKFKELYHIMTYIQGFYDHLLLGRLAFPNCRSCHLFRDLRQKYS